ncbi:9548_t:CDS:2, partial [Gigaspora rosea]
MKQEKNSSSNSTSSSSRSCIFIDASNPKSPNQIVNLDSQPFIKPAFPPVVDVRELMTKQSSGRPSVRGPNAFIIYRKVFFETAREDGYQLPMTIVSSMASQSWELEPQNVKDRYKELAKEANKIRNEISPRSPRQSSSIISEISFNETCSKSSEDVSVSNNFSNIDNIEPKIEIGTEYKPTTELDALVSSSILQQINDYEYGYNDCDSTYIELNTPTTISPSNYWRDLSNDTTLISASDAIIFSNEPILENSFNDEISNYSDFAANYVVMNSEDSYLLDLPIMDIADDYGNFFSSSDG